MSLTIQSGGSITLQGGGGGGGAISSVAHSVSSATKVETTSSSWQALGNNVSVTLTTGTSALVTIGGFSSRTSGTGMSLTGFEVSGASSIEAHDDRSVNFWGAQGTGAGVSATYLVTNLTPGSNVFSLRHRTELGGTAAFQLRSITVMALA